MATTAVRTVSPFAEGENKRGGATDFYPASGYRASGSGGLYNVGADGYAWSSSPISASSVYGSLLSFSSSYVNPENLSNRAYGFPVRGGRE